MTQPFTIETILKSPCGSRNQHLITASVKKKVVKARNDCPQVVAMHWWLKYWCEEKGIQFEKEYRFDKKRRYRFDFAIPEKKLGIEYHGLGFKKMGHTTTKGFNNDAEKFNLANTAGWTMLVYTFATYQNIIQDLEKLIK